MPTADDCNLRYIDKLTLGVRLCFEVLVCTAAGIFIYSLACSWSGGEFLVADQGSRVIRKYFMSH